MSPPKPKPIHYILLSATRGQHNKGNGFQLETVKLLHGDMGRSVLRGQNDARKVCLTFAKIKNKAIPPNETNRSSPAQSMSQADDDSPRVLPGGKGVVA